MSTQVAARTGMSDEEFEKSTGVPQVHLKVTSPIKEGEQVTTNALFVGRYKTQFSGKVIFLDDWVSMAKIDIGDRDLSVGLEYLDLLEASQPPGETEPSEDDQKNGAIAIQENKANPVDPCSWVRGYSTTPKKD